MKAFLEDYDKGLNEKRYIAGELPHLDIEDDQYDIALSSHFLFLYSDNLSLDFHIHSIKEMLRISKEVRIFPILDYNSEISIHYEGVREYFEREGYRVECQITQYEFQKGGNKMLKIYSESEKVENEIKNHKMKGSEIKNYGIKDNGIIDNEVEGKQKIVCDVLDKLNIDYDLKFHPPAHSIEECEEIVHKLGEGVHCKNLFLCNRQETEFFLLLMRFDKKFRTAEVSKQIEKSRLSFAKDEYLEKYLHLKPGSVSPMGLIFDLEHQVHLIIDKDLIQYEKIYFHPCVNTSSLLLKVKDFLDIFIPYTGHVPTLVEIAST